LGKPERKADPGAGRRKPRRAALSNSDADEIRRIRAMPKEVAVLLVVSGIGGIILPGPVGIPFLVLGGLMLWPSAFGRLENFLEKRCPRVHHESVRQIKRLLDDLEHRYPTPK
jgi:hypothetical protein